MVEAKRLLRCLVLAMSAFGCDGTDLSQGGYCGPDFVYPEEFGQFGSSSSVADARLCVFTESPLEVGAFEVGVGVIEGDLVVDGPAASSTLSFPVLTAANSIDFRSCQLARSRFPALETTVGLRLGCSAAVIENPFVFEAAQLFVVDAIWLTGRAVIDTPKLLTIGALELFDVVLSGLFASEGTPIDVTHLTIASSQLAGVRLERIESIDTLEILGATGDLPADAFPDLRRLRRLYINGNSELRDCSLDAFLDQLEAPPESVELANLTLVHCE